MVRDWTRQAARGAGASLLAPVVLLVGAAAIASGGGLGGLGALGQAAAGPALPDLGAPSATAQTLADAEIVGADTSEPPAATGSPGAGAPGSLASGPGGAGSGRPGSGTDPVDVSPLPPSTTPGATSPDPRSPAPPANGGNPQGPGAPSGDIIEDTRGIAESLPGPLGPTTGDILDLLLPPGAR